jgi:curved DNA-binding protein CbpA
MTNELPDLYAILGVPPHASQTEISHAYRALLRRHHPDTRAPADESQSALSDAALQQVLAAYTMLGDPARRADYDKQVGPRSYPAARRPQQRRNRYDAHAQLPIVAGPVRWHSLPRALQRTNDRSGRITRA